MTKCLKLFSEIGKERGRDYKIYHLPHDTGHHYTILNPNVSIILKFWGTCLLVSLQLFLTALNHFCSFNRLLIVFLKLRQIHFIRDCYFHSDHLLFTLTIQIFLLVILTQTIFFLKTILPITASINSYFRWLSSN